MSVEEKPGFQVGKFFYPFPMRFHLGDPVLVEELTGLEWDEFVSRLPDDEMPDGDLEELDPRALLGLFGVAVWHENSTWKRERVIRYTQGVGMDEIEVTGPGAELNVDGRGGTDERPLETTSAGETPSETPAPPSVPAPESPSPPSTPTPTGTSESDIISPE